MGPAAANDPRRFSHQPRLHLPYGIDVAESPVEHGKSHLFTAALLIILLTPYEKNYRPFHTPD
jgi:hypothetical protein